MKISPLCIAFLLGTKQVFQYFTIRILALTMRSYGIQWNGRAGNTADFKIDNSEITKS